MHHRPRREAREVDAGDERARGVGDGADERHAHRAPHPRAAGVSPGRRRSSPPCGSRTRRRRRGWRPGNCRGRRPDRGAHVHRRAVGDVRAHQEVRAQGAGEGRQPQVRGVHHRARRRVEHRGARHPAGLQSPRAHRVPLPGHDAGARDARHGWVTLAIDRDLEQRPGPRDAWRAPHPCPTRRRDRCRSCTPALVGPRRCRQRRLESRSPARAPRRR